jgi:Ser/Thr protein kinase RdoA (MazF antagonist)
MRPVFGSNAAQDEYLEFLATFHDEAQNIARCDHPNVVAVHRILYHEERAYLVMEWVRGCSLKSYIAEHGPLAEPECRVLLTGLMEGLAAVHASGLLHLDIKPDNIMLRTDGSPVLIDFGAARRAHRLERDPSCRVVSDGYSPPEQYDRLANTLGPASDIFALAATGYFAACGQPPAPTMDRVLAVARGRPDPLQPISAAAAATMISSGFEEALRIGLALDEEQRPESVAAWANMFIAAPVPAARPTLSVRLAEGGAPTAREPRSDTLNIGSKIPEDAGTPMPRRSPDGALIPVATPTPRASAWHRIGYQWLAATARVKNWRFGLPAVTASVAMATVLAGAAEILSFHPGETRKSPLVGVNSAAPLSPGAKSKVAAAELAAAPRASLQRCDALIAHPDDPQRPADVVGTDWNAVDVAAARDAIEACSLAVEEGEAETPRLRFNLARAYHRLAQVRPEDRTLYVRLAIASYTAAAERGHAAAQGNLGQMLYDGSAGARDLPKAIEQLRKAAQGGYPDAFLTLAHAHATGSGVEVDNRKTVCWLGLVVRKSSVLRYRRWAEQEIASIALDPVEKRKIAEGTGEPGECLAIGTVGEGPDGTRDALVPTDPRPPIQRLTRRTMLSGL